MLLQKKQSMMPAMPRLADTRQRATVVESDAGDTVEASPAKPSTAARPARVTRWDETALRVKLTMLLCLSMAMGVLAGVLVTIYPSWWWFAPLTGAVLFFVVLPFSHAWVAGPFDRLVRRMEMVARTTAVADLRQLPVNRTDEIGRLARAAQLLGEVCRRYHLEARHLRRNMNHEVEQATRAAVAKLERIAYRDSLTQLGNRRFLDEHLDPLVTAAQSTQSDLLCMIIDIDNFKQVNDQFGHAKGDELLALLGQLLRNSIRPQDMAVRLGGDEFAVFLPQASLQRAYQLTEQMRRLFQQQAKLRFASDPLPGLSIGVADMQQDDCRTGAELLEKADEQLYRVKRAGKNMTCGINFCPIGSQS